MKSSVFTRLVNDDGDSGKYLTMMTMISLLSLPQAKPGFQVSESLLKGSVLRDILFGSTRGSGRKIPKKKPFFWDFFGVIFGHPLPIFEKSANFLKSSH